MTVVKYDFHLRSGKTVTIQVNDLEKVVNGIIERIGQAGCGDDHEWIAAPGLKHAVRWSDIEGWSLNTDTEEKG